MNVRPLRKLLLRLTLFGLLPLAVLTAISGYSGYQSHRTEIERGTADLARAVASAVDSELTSAVWSVQALAASNELRRENLADLQAELAAFASGRPELQSILLADANQSILLRTGTSTGVAVAPVERASLSEALRSKSPQVGSIAVGPKGAYAYPVRVPIVKEGQVKYVLTAAFRPDRVQQLLSRQRAPPDWVISVFDANLRRVARSRGDPSLVGGLPSPTLQDLIRTSRASEGIGVTRALEGDEIITAFTRVPGSNWVVAVGSPTSQVRAFSSAIAFLYVVGVGASLAVAALLAWSLSRRIRTDIQQVIDGAATLGVGRNVTASTSTISEIAALGERVSAADQRVRDAFQAAAQASAEKDRFLALLGHELRNPLAPIGSVLYLLDRKCDESTAGERRILHRQVQHMKRLVDDLLDVSRLVRGELRLDLVLVDLGALIIETVDTFRQSEPAAQIELRTCMDRVELMADPMRLAQVMGNLLMNAVRHGCGRPIQIVLSTEAGYAEVRVTDQGEGMTPETLAQVFTPFYQSQVNAGSLGLGLAVVRGIVERHGGSVHATSSGVGQGSTFTLRLPLERRLSGESALDARA